MSASDDTAAMRSGTAHSGAAAIRFVACCSAESGRASDKSRRPFAVCGMLLMDWLDAPSFWRNDELKGLILRCTGFVGSLALYVLLLIVSQRPAAWIGWRGILLLLGWFVMIIAYMTASIILFAHALLPLSFLVSVPAPWFATYVGRAILSLLAGLLALLVLRFIAAVVRKVTGASPVQGESAAPS